MHRTRRSWFWKVIDVSEPDWLLHLQKTAKILRQNRWTTFQLEEWERMRSSPSPSAWDEAYHTRQPLQRSLWLAASSSSWASPDCGHWWFASSRKVSRRVSCQWWGKRMEKRGFFWSCLRLRRFLFSDFSDSNFLQTEVLVTNRGAKVLVLVLAFICASSHSKAPKAPFLTILTDALEVF